jgi:hypothetical protein
MSLPAPNIDPTPIRRRRMRPCAGIRSLSIPAHRAPLSAFTKDRRSSDGLARICRGCDAAYHAHRRASRTALEPPQTAQEQRSTPDPSPDPLAALPALLERLERAVTRLEKRKAKRRV